MKTKTTTIVLIRSPQALLVGKETGGLYTANRSLVPEPTLPQLDGIIRDFIKESGININIIQLDLRDSSIGKIQDVTYGELSLPYIEELLWKTYSGIPIDSIDILKSADVIGFTSNFAAGRGIVTRHIRKVRERFPQKELWIGGRDVFTDRMIDIYAEAAGRENLVIFHGHVFESLPAYLAWKFQEEGQPFGITLYNSEGNTQRSPVQPLNRKGREITIPLPEYPRPEVLEYFTESAEGQPDSPIKRFVYTTLSIGCPYNCGYCLTGHREKYLVCKDISIIEQELEMYRKMGVTHLSIMGDNLLALGPKKVREIMELINDYGFLIEYGNGLQFSLLNKWWDELANPLFSNCFGMYIPLEDLTQDGMYKKLSPIATELELIKRLAEEKPGLLQYLTMGIVHGVPGHTKEALSTTFLNNLKMFLDVFRGSSLEVAATIFNFMPLAGTVLGDLALNSGRIVIPNAVYTDPEIFNTGITSYAPVGMTHAEVFRIYEQALNLNPAGSMFQKASYVTLQHLGEHAPLLPNECNKFPANWRTPGYPLRARVT